MRLREGALRTLTISILRRLLRYLPGVSALVGWKHFRILKETDVPGRRILKKFSPFPVVRARWDGARLVNLADERARSIGYRAFSDALVSLDRRGGMILDGRSLVVPENGQPGIPKVFFPNTNVAGVVGQHDESVFLRLPSQNEEAEIGIFPGSMAPHNWFHWIIDTLPNIYFSRYLPAEFDDYPLIVPRSVSLRPNWIQALGLAASDRPIRFVDDGHLIRVAHLLKLEPVTRPGPRVLSETVSDRVSVLAGPLLEYRDHVLTQLGLRNVQISRDKRVFLARRQKNARSYNQDEAIAVAAVFGFTEHYMEDLTYRESVKIFREAEFVIGPHGAGWANMLFSASGSNCLMWTWDSANPDNWYQNIAFVSQANYRQLSPQALMLEGGDPRSASYRLDTNSLGLALEELTNSLDDPKTADANTP